MPAVKRLYGTRTALTITLASLANGAGRVSAQVDVTSSGVGPKKVKIDAKIKTASTPTAGSTIQLFLVRAEDASGFVDGALGASDAAVTTPFTATQIRDQLQFIGAIPVIATAQTYQKSFIVDDPGPRFSIYVYNDTGQALDSTGGNHEIAYTTMDDDLN